MLLASVYALDYSAASDFAASPAGICVLSHVHGRAKPIDRQNARTTTFVSPPLLLIQC